MASARFHHSGHDLSKFSASAWRSTGAHNVIHALLALPVRLGGLAIIDPTKTVDAEYESSIRVTAPLIALIVAHEKSLGDSHAQQHSIRKEIHVEKRKKCEETTQLLLEQLPLDMRRNVQLAQEKSSSSWLSVRPPEQHRFVLHKSAFLDAICLRYGWTLSRLPARCACHRVLPLRMR